jgi:DNA-binding MarR family transcriptional regulator
MKRSSKKGAPRTEIRLETFLPFRLNRLAAEVSRRLAVIYADRFGLDIPEWRVMATLSSRRTATAQEIVASTRTHKSTISRAVATLKERGLVEREDSSADGREIVLRLSQAGHALVREIAPLVLEGERVILSRLPPRPQAQLLDVLSALEASLGLDDEEKDP